MISIITCKGEQRREDVRKAALYGLDYVLVEESQRILEVFFLGKLPETIAAANVRITGGRSIRDVSVSAVRAQRQTDPARDEFLSVTVNHPGDFSDYVLSMVATDDAGNATTDPMKGFDVRYASITFNFKVNCPSDLDCKQQDSCSPALRPSPEINYLAKDFDSFRRVIFDRLAITLPGWPERHTADIGVMLVELLAYAGDSLSYYQDAVATEAYLGTARQRISIRRHARLVDYRMHEGCNARALVTLWTDADQSLDLEAIFFTTALDLPGGDSADRHVFQARELDRINPGSYLVFEPVNTGSPIQIYAAQCEMQFYTWGDDQCCLPIGCTRATLAGAGLHLAAGDVLVFEEVIGPGTGDPADVDPTHRQAVRLNRVTEGADVLYATPQNPPAVEARNTAYTNGAAESTGTPIVEIEWCSEDALTFPLCLSARMPSPDCTVKPGISVARGNVVLVDHGARTIETIATVGTVSTAQSCGCDCEPPEVVATPQVVNPQLSAAPLTHTTPATDCACAVHMLFQDPREAIPSVYVTSVPENTTDDGTGPRWTPVPDLLESDSSSRQFVVETDNAGIAHLRFGDGIMGAMPPAGVALTARYRVGNGAAGNVGAETISSLVYRSEDTGGGLIVPRNPMPARGGTEPEPIEAARQFAPSAFRHTLERAITADDYATLAADNARRLSGRARLASGAELPPPAPLPREAQEEEAGEELPELKDICRTPFRNLQGARAKLRWTGSWNEVFVALDPSGDEEVPPELLDEVLVYLDPYRRIGHDVSIGPPIYIGLDVALRVCLLPEYLRAHVEAALLDVLSNRVLADGTRGIFHPDNLTFGDGIYASRIIGAAQAVQGVQSCALIRLKRYVIGEPPPLGASASGDLPLGGKLSLGPFEIARLDDDPGFPERGRLTLTMGGGR
jgi:hypothetical protein